MEMNLTQEFVLVRSTGQCYHRRTYSTTSPVIAIGYKDRDKSTLATDYGIFSVEVDCCGREGQYNKCSTLGSQQ